VEGRNIPAVAATGGGVATRAGVRTASRSAAKLPTAGAAAGGAGARTAARSSANEEAFCGGKSLSLFDGDAATLRDRFDFRLRHDLLGCRRLSPASSRRAATPRTRGVPAAPWRDWRSGWRRDTQAGVERALDPVLGGLVLRLRHGIDRIAQAIRLPATLGLQVVQLGGAPLLGLPAIALSLQIEPQKNEVHWSTVEEHAPGLIRKLLRAGWPRRTLINVNFPNALPDDVTGVEVTRQADRTMGAHVFDAVNGGPILWQHLFWFFGHPEGYIMILPSMGVLSELIACFSRKRIFGYGFVAFSSQPCVLRL